MALSSWDMFAVSSNDPCNGVLERLNGAKVEIYKNWLYVHDKEMWLDHRGFDDPVVAEIQEGDISISGFDIVAVRGPQNGVFVIALCEEIENHKATYMAGIGCYGYDNNIPRLAAVLGIDINKWSNICNVSCSGGKDGDKIGLSCSNEDPVYENETHFIQRKGNEHLEPQWVGVTQKTIKEFFEWVFEWAEKTSKGKYWSKKGFLDWIKEMKTKEWKRFNQGDAFFANTYNTNITEIDTLVEKSEKPIVQTLEMRKKCCKYE